ncbi:hypothetical protein BH23BAC2_BH23BAC2_17240 [soil metagenome]
MTKTKYEDQVLKVTIRTFASILVALSGLILFADKVYPYELSNNYGFADSQTFIWVFSQTLAPLLLVVGLIFRPYFIAITIPVYIYFIQMFWVFNPVARFDDALLQTYAIGTVAGFVALVVAINWYFHRASNQRQRTISQLERALDLDLIGGLQNLIRFIVVDVKRNYIAETDKKKFVQDYMAQLDKIDKS